MIRPQPFNQYDEIDLKLAIKSSFPDAKSTLALLVMLWKVSDNATDINYSQANSAKIVISDDIKDKLIKRYNSIYSSFSISDNKFVDIVNNNQLFKSQLEPLLVGIELVWRIAKISFVDGKAQGAERTGGTRFPKILSYTCNIDVIDIVLSSNEDEYSKILLKWLGCDVSVNQIFENYLVRLLTYLAENSFYRLNDNGKEVIFNANSIYKTLLDNLGSNIDISGDGESKGSLRTLKSSLTEGLNPFLSYSNGDVSVSAYGNDNLEHYQKRVDNYLHLHFGTTRSAEKIMPSPNENNNLDESKRRMFGDNYLLYGVPGSGKSHTIKTEYCDDESLMERVVFHPDYTYSDFVGQIMPKIGEDKCVYYDFSPGPFTRMLKKAYNNPSQEFFLVIEELNRGNAPAIFGEVFQLLDRIKDHNEGRVGNSQYGITNPYIADVVYENPEKLVFIPSNLNIVATMNTSDQNVFTLDTAFQRRWHMRIIENNIDGANHVNNPILDTTVTWGQFNKIINKRILTANSHLTSSEDKRLGAYFVTLDDLIFSKSGDKKIDEKQNRCFPEKVLKYLWDDAFKFNRSEIFNTDTCESLEVVIRIFRENNEDERFKKIFNESLLSELNLQ